MSELAQNCFDHNAGTCGFLAMQTYGKGKSRFLEIAVPDPVLATNTVEPSGVAANRVGFDPTRTTVLTVLVAVLMHRYYWTMSLQRTLSASPAE